MKALTWMRKLAATTALLALTLALVAPIAEANVPRRPIDSPEGPPEPNPTEVGDPDTPPGGLPVSVVIGNQVILVRVPTRLIALYLRAFGVGEASQRWAGSRRAPNAR